MVLTVKCPNMFIFLYKNLIYKLYTIYNIYNQTTNRICQYKLNIIQQSYHK